MAGLPRYAAGRAGTLLTVTALAIAAGGCARGVDDSDRSQVRSTAQVFLRLCAEQRGRDVVDLLNRSAGAQFTRAGGVLPGCAAILRVGRGLAPGELHGARVTAVQVVGPGARARIALSSGTTATLDAERSDNGWYLTNDRFGR